MTAPTHKVTLVKRPGVGILEETPRYDVLLNGAKVDQLYFNTKGYQGTIPMVDGSRLTIGERAISAYVREVAKVNREALTCIKGGMEDPRKVSRAVATQSSNYVGLVTMIEGENPEVTIVSRQAWISAQKLFGKDTPIGIGFFQDHNIVDQDKPALVYHSGNDWLQRALPEVRSVVADAELSDALRRYVDEVHPTANPDTKLVITRNDFDDGDPEPFYVNAFSLKVAASKFGDAMRLSDIAAASPEPILDPGARSAILRNCIWFDLSAGTVPAEEQQREFTKKAMATLDRLSQKRAESEHGKSGTDAEVDDGAPGLSM